MGSILQVEKALLRRSMDTNGMALMLARSKQAENKP
jgi:hypothetical protein